MVGQAGDFIVEAQEQTGNSRRKTVGQVFMFHCCTLSGRRIVTPRTYIAVLPGRYIQVLLTKKLIFQIETRYFRAAPSLEGRGQTFFPVRGAFKGE